MRIQLAASIEYLMVRTDPSAMAAVNTPECGPPNRTDQKVGDFEVGCMESDWGTASPNRTWSWSHPELFHTSLSPPAEPMTEGWSCFSPTMMVFEVPSPMSAIRRN